MAHTEIDSFVPKFWLFSTTAPSKLDLSKVCSDSHYIDKKSMAKFFNMLFQIQAKSKDGQWLANTIPNTYNDIGKLFSLW